MKVDMRHGYWWLVALLLGLPAQAAILDVTAEYNPSSYAAKFIHTTPCNTPFPSYAPIDIRCSAMDTVDTPRTVSFHLGFLRQVFPDVENHRREVHHIAFPAEKHVTMARSSGGAIFSLKFILTAVGAEVEHELGSGTNIRIPEYGDCNGGTTWNNQKLFFYYRDIDKSRQKTGGLCYGKYSALNTRRIYISSGYLGYKMEVATSPLKIEAGTYTGKLLLTMGNSNDLDFGYGHQADDQLAVYFTFIVRQSLKVDFPTGSNRIVLQPPQGWSDWQHRGGKPPNYLDAILPARFTTSNPYEVSLKCQYLNADVCQIKNTKNDHKVTLSIYATGLNNKEWLLHSTRKEKFYDHITLLSSLRPFRFRVNTDSVKEMMKYPGSTYKGDVTLIIDATL